DQVAEDAADTDTADGRPATRVCAHGRLARMLCGDSETVTRTAAVALAKRLALVQRQVIDRAARRQTFRGLVLSGSGEFLARQVFAAFDGPVVSLAERLGPRQSAAACAVAVARLLDEEPNPPAPFPKREGG